MTLLDRDDLIGALHDLVAELHAEGESVGLQIVGGAALALRAPKVSRSAGPTLT